MPLVAQGRDVSWHDPFAPAGPDPAQNNLLNTATTGRCVLRKP